MRTLMFILAFLLLAPAAPVSGCERENASPAHPHHEQHALVQRDDNQAGQHDCCNAPSDPVSQPCSQIQLCHAAGASGLVETSPYLGSSIGKMHHGPDRFTGLIPPSHAHPPYRPPAV